MPTNELFIVEYPNGEIDDSQDMGGFTVFLDQPSATEALDYSEEEDGAAVVRFVRDTELATLRDQVAGLREALGTLNHAAKVAVLTQYGENLGGAPLTIRLLDGTCSATDELIASAPSPAPSKDQSPDAGKMVPAIAKDCAAELAKSNVAEWREKAELLDVALSCKNVREQIWWSFEDEGNCVPPTGADAIIGILRKELAALRAAKAGGK